MIRILTPLLLVVGSYATEVRYANEAAEILQGARLPAVAGVTLGLPPDPGGLGRSPAGLAEYEHPELVVHHAVLYSGLGATQDEILLAVPLQNHVGVGAAVSRVGADGIMRVDEGEDPDFQDPRTFSASDWVGTLGFGRAWFQGRLLGGAAVRFLLRDLDQTGIGAQTEGSVVWKSPQGWRLGARLDRGFGSFASWESGRREFSPADLMVGAGLEKKMPYFYGRGFLGWESPGLVQGEGGTTFTDQDVRLHKDPWLFLRASRLGGEFQFDFGGVLRAGGEVQALTRLTDFLQDKDEDGLFGESSGMVSFGVGYLWSNRARMDYALVVDPDLGSMHRVALGLVFGVPRERKAPVTEDLPRTAPEPIQDTALAVPDTTPQLADTVVQPAVPDSAAVPVVPDSAMTTTPAVEEAPMLPPPAVPVVPADSTAPVSVPAESTVPADAAAPAETTVPVEPQQVASPPTPPEAEPAAPAKPVEPPEPSSNDEWDAPETTE